MSDLNKRCKSDPMAKCQYIDEIEELRSYLAEEREKNEIQVRMTMNAQAEIERLRAALERIAAIPVHHVGWREIAREALEGGDE